MAYIYAITNRLNNKIYVGATTRHPNRRFVEHCRDARRFPTRSLYIDINQYGPKCFDVDILEQCSDDVMNEREMYWIERLGSFRDGYNETLGGAGKAHADKNIIITLWQQGKTNIEIPEITSYDKYTIQSALNECNITKAERQRRGNIAKLRSVVQLDAITNHVICTYDSIQDAYTALGKPHSGHIAAVCAGERSTAYGYKWAYAEGNT